MDMVLRGVGLRHERHDMERMGKQRDFETATRYPADSLRDVSKQRQGVEGRCEI